jgi:O-antigen/teichoic acid export membrane protein
MLFYALTLTLLSSIDRMVIAASFESRALGLYHLGFISAQGLFMAFNSIALLFYPRWLKYFHEQDSQNKFNSIKEQTLMIELILVCLSLVGIFLIPLFVNLLLPEYKVSILITQFLLIALIANGLTFVTSTFLISNNHQIKIVPIVSFVILSALVMNYFFIWLGYGLYGIATSTTIAFYAYAFIMTILTLNITSSFSLSNILFFYKRLIFFVPFTLILLYEKFNLVWVFLLFLLIYFNLTKDLMVKFIKLYKPQRPN